MAQAEAGMREVVTETAGPVFSVDIRAYLFHVFSGDDAGAGRPPEGGAREVMGRADGSPTRGDRP
ncbi:hypothetical protein GCM10010255_17480 [Streptomyces coeruleofuscus]|uniref:Uncharacterized protein n=1 Tax=Streptomyces coeruleofuscus TaxID=66879 RepID=A0ABN3HXS2_9ACTN